MTAPFQPTFNTPSAPGQLSNQHGSNLTTDAIKPSVHYINPRGTNDGAGTIRTVWTRVGQGGIPSAPLTMWDSGWASNPVSNSLPSGTDYGFNSNAVVYNNRVYVAERFGSQRIWSAPLTGGSTGSWRAETPLIGAGAICEGLTVVSGKAFADGYARLYAMLSAAPTNVSQIGYSPIYSDGTLGAWQFTSTVPANDGFLCGLTCSASSPVPNQGFLISVASRTIYYGGGSSAATSALTTVQVVGLNQDGSLQTWNATTSLPAALTNPAVYCDDVNKYVVVAGGFSGAATVTTVYTATVGNLVLGAWQTQTSTLPVALAMASLVVADGYIFVVGGNTGGSNATSVATVYSAPISTIVSTTQIGTWSAALTPALPVALSSPAVWSNPVRAPVATFHAYITATGGIGTGGGAGPTTSYVIENNGTGGLVGSWLTGAQVLSLTNVTVTVNQDGSQDIVFPYNGFGTTAGVTSLSDGDLVQVLVQFTDSQNGDVSLAASTQIKIGQPPSISGAAATAAGLVTFNYIPGLGGAYESSFRVQVDNGLFDSDIVKGAANNIQLLQAPWFPNGIARIITITVYSYDTPMSGSSTQTSSTLVWTPSYTAPAVPTGLAVTPNANGSVTLTWTNPVASTATFNRIYHRRSSSGAAFTLLVDRVTAVIGSQQSLVIWDRLARTVAYDFAVAATIGFPPTAESALSTSVSGTVPFFPDTSSSTGGGKNVVLHVKGNGANYNIGLSVKGQDAVVTRRTPGMTTVIEVVSVPMFGASVPAMRSGIKYYRTFEFTAGPITTTDLKALQGLIQQSLAGNPFYYRDAFGIQLLCSFDGQPDIIEHRTPLYRFVHITFAEVADQYSPSTSRGSATGYFQQKNGTLVPLDTSELGL